MAAVATGSLPTASHNLPHHDNPTAASYSNYGYASNNQDNQQDPEISALDKARIETFAPFHDDFDSVVSEAKTENDLDHLESWADRKCAEMFGDLLEVRTRATSATGRTGFSFHITDIEKTTDRLDQEYSEQVVIARGMDEKLREHLWKWTRREVADSVAKARMTVASGGEQTSTFPVQSVGGTTTQQSIATPTQQGQTSEQNSIPQSSDPASDQQPAPTEEAQWATTQTRLSEALQAVKSADQTLSQTQTLGQTLGQTSNTQSQNSGSDQQLSPADLQTRAAKSQMRHDTLSSNSDFRKFILGNEYKEATKEQQDALLRSLLKGVCTFHSDSDTALPRVVDGDISDTSTANPQASSGPPGSSPGTTPSNPYGAASELKGIASFFAKNHVQNPSKELIGLCRLLDEAPLPEEGTAPISRRLEHGMTFDTGPMDKGVRKKLTMTDDRGGVTSVEETFGTVKIGDKDVLVRGCIVQWLDEEEPKVKASTSASINTAPGK